MQGVYEQPVTTNQSQTITSNSIPVVGPKFQKTLGDRFQEQIIQTAKDDYTEHEQKIFEKIGRGGNNHAYQNASIVIGLLIADAENFINYMTKLGEDKMKMVQLSAINWFNYNGITLSIGEQIMLFTKIQDIYDLNSLSGLKKQFNNLFREASDCFHKRK